MPIAEIKIKKLEKEVKELWQIVGDEVFWHPARVKEIKRRSAAARRNFKNLRLADKVFSSLEL